MSSSACANNTANAKKKAQEEKNLRALRELAALGPNKHCFECGQRGPTYVNVSEGSFCCTACSGLLRGLNPPHRVKSISMATFTEEEIEKVRRIGNEGNARTWLGLYDGPMSKFDSPRDEEKIKDHLNKKYERRRWFVSPAEQVQQEKLMAMAVQANAREPSINSDGGSLGGGATGTGGGQAKPSPPHPSADLFFSSDIFGVSPRSSLDTVSTLSSLSTNTPAPSSSIFADFDAQFSGMKIAPPPPITPAWHQPIAQPAVPSPAVVALPKSATIGALGASPVATVPTPIPTNGSSRVTNGHGGANSGDKYSALAELDQLFHGSPSSSATMQQVPAMNKQWGNVGQTRMHDPPVNVSHSTFPVSFAPSPYGVSSLNAGQVSKSNTTPAFPVAFDSTHSQFARTGNPFANAPGSAAFPPSTGFHAQANSYFTSNGAAGAARTTAEVANWNPFWPS